MSAVERASATHFRDVGLEEVMASVTTPRAQLARGAEDGRLLVATEPAGAVVGFALLSVLDGDVHLDELAVLPAHARRGLGRALVEGALAVAVREGRPRMTLTTLTLVPWTTRLYAPFGFRALAGHEIGRELRAACGLESEGPPPDDGRVVLGLVLTATDQLASSGGASGPTR